jgi:hypothetical protein
VRDNQLVSTIESMYSGENVVVISPDSENLSILTAAVINNDPDTTLPTHAQFFFKNGEVKILQPFIQKSELLFTGQTEEEADAMTRRMKAMRVIGTSKFSKTSFDTWFDLWHTAIDNN